MQQYHVTTIDYIVIDFSPSLCTSASSTTNTVVTPSHRPSHLPCSPTATIAAATMAAPKTKPPNYSAPPSPMDRKASQNADLFSEQFVDGKYNITPYNCSYPVHE